jgi:hypothetical protein
MADPRRYTHDKSDGTPSAPEGLAKVMAAAARNVKVGEGAFRVTRGGAYHHPGLSRVEALSITKEILKTEPVGAGVVVRNAKGNNVFHATRVAVVPYKNPFRDVAGLWPLRIDAGVDYACSSQGGPVYPLGNAVITNVGTPSRTLTFGNDMAVYQLLDGPAKGKFVFFAEMYFNMPNLHNGMRVTADTPIYRMDGPIEIGWSDGRGSMAWDLDGNIEGQRTAWGDNFNELLKSLDCRPGLELGRSVTMNLPAGWPTEW